MEQGRETQIVSISLCSLRAPPQAPRCVPDQYRAPQAEAPAQANTPLSQKDWGCVCLLSVQCSGGGSLPRNVSDCYSLVGPRLANSSGL